MSFKKIINKYKMISVLMLGICIGIVITGGIGVIAITMNADQIKYTPSNKKFTATNIQEAMDEVYKLSEYKIPADTYFYDSKTSGESIIRYKKIDGKYYLCDKNGIVINNEETDVSNVALIEYQNSDNDTVKIGYASFSDGNLNLGDFKGATKIKRTLIASNLNSFEVRTIDLKSYEGYQNFTSDQFIMADVSQTWHRVTVVGDKPTALNPVYDPTSGILTIDSSYAWDNDTFNFYFNYNVYLLTVE